MSKSVDTQVWSPRPLHCLGTSREQLRAFPAEARERAGLELYLVQQGLEPRDWKPMPGVGVGVREIRARQRLADLIRFRREENGP